MIILISEDAQLELRLARHENIQLRKQFYESHQSYVEKTSELESQLQSVEHLLANNGTKTIQVRIGVNPLTGLVHSWALI